MTAESRTLASATTAAGRTPLGEVSQDLLFRHPSRLTFSSDGITQFDEKLAAKLQREVGLIPGDVETGRLPVARYEDDILRMEHLASSVAEMAHRYNLHCGHLRVHYSSAEMSFKSLSRPLSGTCLTDRCAGCPLKFR
ncbi:MAG: hypothetical protein DLM70_19325, partial [Chloroflexi bacterium]